MNNIFISYRREDSEGFARGLFQSLVSAFGTDHVFMDVEDISLGSDFVNAIDKSLAGCGASETDKMKEMALRACESQLEHVPADMREQTLKVCECTVMFCTCGSIFHQNSGVVASACLSALKRFLFIGVIWCNLV